MQTKIRICVQEFKIFRVVQGNGFVLRQATDVVMSEEARSLVMGIIGEIPGDVLGRMQPDVQVVAGELIRPRKHPGKCIERVGIKVY